MSQATPTEKGMRPSSLTLVPIHRLFAAQVIPKLDGMSVCLATLQRGCLPQTCPVSLEPTISSSKDSKLHEEPSSHGFLQYPAPSISV